MFRLRVDRRFDFGQSRYDRQPQHLTEQLQRKRGGSYTSFRLAESRGRGERGEPDAGVQAKAGGGSGAHFQHGARAEGEPDAASRDPWVNAHNACIPVDECNVDRIPHTEGVDAGAGCDQQCLLRGERRTDQQTQRAGNEAVRDSHAQPAGRHGTVEDPRHQIPDLISWTAIGKPITMKVHGKMHMISGPSILTGASSASFSARWKRSVRRCSDCARRIGPRLLPIISPCTRALTRLLMGPKSSRDAMSRIASVRGLPARTSRNRRLTSATSGPGGILSTAVCSAEERFNPPSTDIVTMSRKKGNPFRMRRLRDLAMSRNHISGQ